jgi:hypothetical protein
MTQLAALKDDLQALYERAFAARQHAIAYHALAALLHAAEGLRDAILIAEIEQHARRHLDWLDANDPRHIHASVSAAKRGHPGIFAQLAATAAAASARVRAEEVQRRQEEKRRPRAPSA